MHRTRLILSFNETWAINRLTLYAAHEDFVDISKDEKADSSQKHLDLSGLSKILLYYSLCQHYSLRDIRLLVTLFEWVDDWVLCFRMNVVCQLRELFSVLLPLKFKTTLPCPIVYIFILASHDRYTLIIRLSPQPIDARAQVTRPSLNFSFHRYIWIKT